MNYQKFIESKKKKAQNLGFEATDLNSHLFPFQRYIVKRALLAGKYAIFADCGMGKTLMQLAYADAVVKHTNKPVLILAPLAVSGQTIQEGVKFGIEVNKIDRTIDKGIYITNYEQLKNIDASVFSGVVLDESSILKNFTGKLRNEIIDSFQNTPFKLACTATPSPNDPMELGNHSEFLNVMSRVQMLAMFFVHDSKSTQDWRLKRHGVGKFYQWVNTWACMISNPCDLGFDGSQYVLPALELKDHSIKTEKINNGKLFNDVAVSATNYNAELRRTMTQRISKAAEIANSTNQPVIIWVKQNEEGKQLKKLVPDAIEVSGSDNPEIKESRLLGFAKGEFRVLITKTKIAQFGLNYQNCSTQIFVSPDFSFEGTYQAIRRSYRFGQQNTVNVHLIVTDTMQNIIQTFNRKQRQFIKMQEEMSKQMNSKDNKLHEHEDVIAENNHFKIMMGDCVERIKEVADNSMDFSFFSPPFSSLFTFSDNSNDMSNCNNHDEFWRHFNYLVPELERVMKPGRIVAVHGTQLTTSIGKDGFLSVINFRGDLIRSFQDAGFYFHGEVFIRKNPQLAAVRTKDKQLMHGQTKRDAAICRPGLADFVLFFRKSGTNAYPVNYEKNGIPFNLWCKLAEPIWMDVEESDVLKGWQAGRGENDERHITPTQLKPIHNSILIYSNPGDTVFCPFAGIGSEAHQAISMGRKFVGIELKESYFVQAVKNAKNACAKSLQQTLF